MNFQERLFDLRRQAGLSQEELANLVGVTRQVAVLAFQFGDGFTNLVVPTSGALIGCLGAARMDFGQWVKFSIKLMAFLFVFSTIFIVAAVLMGYN